MIRGLRRTTGGAEGLWVRPLGFFGVSGLERLDSSSPFDCRSCGGTKDGELGQTELEGVLGAGDGRKNSNCSDFGEHIFFGLGLGVRRQIISRSSISFNFLLVSLSLFVTAISCFILSRFSFDAGK